ncbi:hypothetical protein DFA_01519 [Cavenderia fasciculata]|uniref:Uncharacterized protein n=1 Tax=Cavenderia fasciculata TaxID=261658 RepID=F4PT57_CACFS|nr:uncharacterized protein DFA_01519 [Cavenderia fasciculata]EGG21633.1 hypothetical protein DFA_01519 [Cavenderia fasciculata]|eukprot:XP_004359483.1 hypothetical protein DFA_01519 [Cavenderia fasciculata]
MTFAQGHYPNKHHFLPPPLNYNNKKGKIWFFLCGKDIHYMEYFDCLKIQQK